MVKFNCKIFLLLLFATSTLLKSQQAERDSLEILLKQVSDPERIHVLNDLSRAYWDISLEKSLEYAQEAYSLSLELNSTIGEADALNRIGNAKHLGGDPESAVDYYYRSLSIRQEIHDLEGVLSSHNNLVIAYSLMGEDQHQLEHLKNAYEVSNESDNEENVAVYARRLGLFKSSRHEFKKAVEYFDVAYEKYRSAGNSRGIASVYNGRGTMYNNMALYYLALENYLNSLRIYKEEEAKRSIAALLINIGNIHKKLDNLDLALEYYLNSLDLYGESETDRSRFSAAYNNIGVIYFGREDYEMSLKFYNKALEINEDAENHSGIAAATNNIGLVETRLENYDIALDSYHRSAEINKKYHRRHHLANNYNNFGELFILTRDFDQSEKYLDHALDIALELNAREVIKENYLFRAELLSLQEDYSEALHYRKLFDEYRDSIYTSESNEIIAELHVGYESENRLKELEILKKENELHQLKLLQQQNSLYHYAAIMLLVVILIFLIYSFYKFKKRSNITLEEKNKELEKINRKLYQSEQELKKLSYSKDKFFSIIAHDLKNPFNALLGFSQMLSDNLNELKKQEIRTYVDIIFKSAENLYLLLENLLNWSKSQTGSMQFNPEKFNLKEVTQEVADALQIHSDKKNIRVLNKIDPDHKVFADKNIYSTIVRNLLGNSIKFTDTGGQITLSSTEKDDFVEVSVSDNGTGIDPEQLKKLFTIEYNVSKEGTHNEKGTGLGLALSKEFAEINGGEIFAVSTPGEGSTFKFTVPKK